MSCTKIYKGFFSLVLFLLSAVLDRRGCCRGAGGGIKDRQRRGSSQQSPSFYIYLHMCLGSIFMTYANICILRLCHYAHL